MQSLTTTLARIALILIIANDATNAFCVYLIFRPFFPLSLVNWQLDWIRLFVLFIRSRFNQKGYKALIEWSLVWLALFGGHRPIVWLMSAVSRPSGYWCPSLSAPLYFMRYKQLRKKVPLLRLATVPVRNERANARILLPHMGLISVAYYVVHQTVWSVGRRITIMACIRVLRRFMDIIPGATVGGLNM